MLIGDALHPSRKKVFVPVKKMRCAVIAEPAINLTYSRLIARRHALMSQQPRENDCHRVAWALRK